jgi:hypothetical protein
MRFKPARRLMEAATGIAAGRQMEPFSSEPLAPRVPTVDPEGRKVAYFHGCFGGYQDVEGEGRAAVDLLEALGCTVAIPPQECCRGVYGHLDDAPRPGATWRSSRPGAATKCCSAPSCGLAPSRLPPPRGRRSRTCWFGISRTSTTTSWTS